ncbi:MAG TPA: citramalate synthase [Firmicutes bacterium]|nr:citramalate synthase [Bacillota bacterium]
MSRVYFYDTTLRDGSQGEGVIFSVEDKIRIAKKLDLLGIDYIEGGWPGSNPKDLEFFRKINTVKFNHAKLAAFGSTRRPGNQTDQDPVLLNLLAVNTPVVAIFGKSWGFHVEEVLRVPLAENLVIIEDSVRFLKSHDKEVVYDAEHFFDGYKDNPSYALETLKAALRGGADSLVLCDTNGGTLPLEFIEIFQAIRKEFSSPLGVHIHNDGGMATAISIIAAQQGATQIQGTFNGYGERCGNANFNTIIPSLLLKLGFDAPVKQNLTMLTETSRLISELSNLPHDERQPYVGSSAFAHKAGMHIDAIKKNSGTFEHIDPSSVGNRRRFLLSEQAGRSTILLKAQDLIPDLTKDDPRVQELTDKLKLLEHLGYQFEAADASFELLIKKAFNLYNKTFSLGGFRIIVEKKGDEPVFSEATIKVTVDGEEELTTAEGDGPVNALDCAIRKALRRFYPQITTFQLTDYKVRVLEENRGTEAVVRVLIQTTDGRHSWGTVGASANIIEASWQALADSIQYGIHKSSIKGQQPCPEENS